ncbi:MAG: class I SAM-dependent methyltransferase [Sphingomonas sp.]
MNREDWQGAVGDVWAEEAQRTDRSFEGLAPALNAAIVAAAPAGPIDALDIGCGAGITSIAFADARPDARITGIDISPNLVTLARARLEGRRNLAFVVGDAVQEAPRHGPAQLLFSRHGVMFFLDPVAAFAALHAAAAPGARLIFSCFRAIDRNPWAALVATAAGSAPAPGRPDMPGPFAFADPALVTPILTAAGWNGVTCAPVDYAYRAGQGDDPVADAVAFFTRIGPTARLLHDMPAGERPATLARVEAVLAEHRSGDTVEFPAAAWIWSAHA